MVYYIGPSRIHGRGVMSQFHVPQGRTLGPVFRSLSRNGTDYVQLSRMGQYMNHSNRPNVHVRGRRSGPYKVFEVVSLRDILPDEEICADYRTCPPFILRPHDLGF